MLYYFIIGIIALTVMAVAAAVVCFMVSLARAIIRLFRKDGKTAKPRQRNVRTAFNDDFDEYGDPFNNDFDPMDLNNLTDAEKDEYYPGWDGDWK